MRFSQFSSIAIALCDITGLCIGSSVPEPSPVVSPHVGYKSDGMPDVLPAGTSPECVGVAMQIKKTGGSTYSSVRAFCDNECDFNERLVRTCEIVNTRLFDAYLPSANQVNEFIKELIKDPDSVGEADIYTDATRDKIADMILLTVHAMLGLVPLMFAQRKWMPGWGAIALSTSCVLFTYITSSSITTVVVTSIASAVAHVLPNSSAVSEVVLYNSMSIFITVLVSVTVSNNLILIAVGLGAITVMSYNLGHGVTTKQRSAGATATVTILQLLMFLDVISIIIDLRGEEYALLRYMMYFIKCAFPHGKSRMVIYNMLGNAARMTSGSLALGNDIVAIYVGWLAINLVIFCGSRAVMGMLIRINTRVKSGDGLVADDLVVYLADVAAPFRWLLSISQGKARSTSPGFLYGALSAGLMMYEIYAANDLLAARIVTYIISKVMHTHHYKASTFLGAIDFSNMSYKTIGALPWLSTSKLRDIQRGVHEVTFRCASGAVRGVATAMGRGKFITVGHCVFQGDANTATLRVNGSPVTFEIHPQPLYDGDHGVDPVYEFSIPSSTDIDTVPSDVGITCGTEFVSLTIVNNEHVCMVPDFNLEWGDNQVSITSGLAKGDSGSPIIAIGATGELSVLAVVSSGSGDPTVPNRGSLATRARGTLCNSSPPNDSMYFGGTVSPKASIATTAVLTEAEAEEVPSATSDTKIDDMKEDLDDAMEALSASLTDMLESARVVLTNELPEIKLDADGGPGDGRPHGEARRIKSARKNARAHKARELVGQALTSRGLDVSELGKAALCRAATMGANTRVKAFNSKRGFGKIDIDILAV